MTELYCPICGDTLSKTVEWNRGKLVISIFCETCGEFDMEVSVNFNSSAGSLHPKGWR